MNRCRNLTRLFGLIALIAVVATLGSVPASAQAGVTGALYTTDSTCLVINQNLYPNKTDVYINGGPSKQDKLTTGFYYVQVTDPSGTVLGTSVGSSNPTPVEVDSSGGPGPNNTTTGKFVGCYELSLIVNSESSILALSPAPGYDDTPNPGGEYKVWISLDSTFQDNKLTKTDNFKVQATVVCPPGTADVDGKCVTLPSITGVKWYDVNTNGVLDLGEVGIPGWKITKTPPTPADVDFTNSSGAYSFIALTQNTTYTIAEVMPNPTWINTTATSGPATTGSTGNTAGPNFGNVCLGPGGGLTLGFWSNKNGQALFGADDLALMVSLHLRNANGSDFNPTSYSAFRTWILNATATNMAYMLSAQLATMELNVNNGFVSSGALIYAPGTSSANANGFASVGAIMAEADAALGADGLTLSGNPDRTIQEALKNALDSANNNRTFVQGAPCAFTTPY